MRRINVLSLWKNPLIFSYFELKFNYKAFFENKFMEQIEIQHYYGNLPTSFLADQCKSNDLGMTFSGRCDVF